MKAKQKSRKQKGKITVSLAEVNLDEDEEMDHQRSEDSEEEMDEEEVGDDGQFMNLVDILDGKGADNNNETNPKVKDNQLFTGNHQNNEESQSEEDEEEVDDDDQEEEMAFVPSENEEGPNALEQLQTFVTKLEVTARKRKALDGAGVEHKEKRARKRRLLQEKTEAGEENEFNVRSSGE